MSSRIRTLIVALLAFALVAVPASASPEDVIREFQDNRQDITSKYSWSDLRGAVTLGRTVFLGDDAYQVQLADEVQRVIARDHLGLAEAPATTMDPARLPSWIIALATATFILIATGIAAAVWRRVRPLR